MRFFDETDLPFLPGEYCIRLASTPGERAGHFALRRAVFCVEQAVFHGSDQDATDRHATPIVAMTCLLGAPDSVVGTVRIHEEAPGLWRGSRLAVHRDHRRVGRLGAELIRMAVCTAHQRGATRFTAQVQAQNVPLFRRLHWHSLEAVMLHGLPHHVMQADLDHYPPHGASETRLVRPLARLTQQRQQPRQAA